MLCYYLNINQNPVRDYCPVENRYFIISLIISIFRDFVKNREIQVRVEGKPQYNSTYMLLFSGKDVKKVFPFDDYYHAKN